MNDKRPSFGEHEFRKASASDPHKECVRVARRDGWVEIRDDKTTFGTPDDHRLVFTDLEFDHFLAGVRSGTTTGLCLEMTRHGDGTHNFRRTSPYATGGASSELRFTDAEVAAFLAGVHAGEFDVAAYARSAQP